MTRHFLTLYLSIVIVLAAVSWGQERLWQSYGGGARERAAAGERADAPRSDSCKQCRREQRADFVADCRARHRARPRAARAAGRRGSRGDRRPARTASRSSWTAPTADRGSCSASSRTAACSRSGSRTQPQRRLPDWILSFVFYAAIALVIMMWLWPMTRDLRTLERSTVRFGDRNWSFDAVIANALAGVSARRSVPSHGGAHRRTDRLAQGHVECAVARDQDAARAHAVRDRAGARRRGPRRLCSGISTT